MSFGFGAAAAKPLFGTQVSASAPATGFTFGAQTASAPSSFGFGNPATTSTPSTGFSFGSTNNAVPGFGLGFGNTSTAGTSGFGIATTSAPAFTFGTSTATTSAPSLFGAAAAVPVAGTTGFGNTFGSAAGFGASGSNTAGFGTGTGLFGTSAGFGSGTGTFGITGSTGVTGGTSNTGVFGGGGAVSSNKSIFGAPQPSVQQQQADASQNALALVHAAVHMPVVFSDERDAVIVKWNQLQAFWGTGKGYVNQSTSVDFGLENPYCCFKAVGYSNIPKSKDEDGLVSLVTNKSRNDLEANQQASVNFLSNIIGNQQTLSVCVECIRELPDDKTEMVIYVQERLPTGAAKRVPASLLTSELNKNTIMTQLKAAGVELVAPKAALSSSALKFYLENPPAGLDSLLWEQAKKDNPAPDTLLPVPMVGFSELHRRQKYQEQQCALHQSRLNVIQEDISSLQQKQANTLSRIEDCKRKHLELSHRLLHVIVKQETNRKMGYGILAEEEQLRVKLESLQQELNAPTQFKSRLNELLSQIRLQSQSGLSVSGDSSAPLDPAFQAELKQLLSQLLEGVSYLISTIKEDIADLDIVEDGYSDTPPSR